VLRKLGYTIDRGSRAGLSVNATACVGEKTGPNNRWDDVEVGVAHHVWYRTSPESSWP
jgi:hypothetical protein